MAVPRSDRQALVPGNVIAFCNGLMIASFMFIFTAIAIWGIPSDS
jgi:hypothetical protein